MRILHVDSAATWRGGQNQVLLTARGMAARGHDVTLACRSDGQLEARARTTDLRLHPLPFHGDLAPSAALSLARLARAWRPDVVHAHDPHALSAAALASLMTHGPWLVATRRVDFPLRGRLSRWKYERAGRVVAVSQAIRRVLEGDGLPAQRLRVVYEGVTERAAGSGGHAALRSLGVPEGAPVVGNVAALTDHKDHATLVDAAALVVARLPETRFVVLGEGEERARLTARIRERHLDGRFILAGFREDVDTILPAFDVFCLSSHMEGLGTSLLDAMMFGVPVVATAAGGIPEAVEDGVTGVLVPPRHPEALAAALVALLGDAARRASFGSAARRRYEERFRVETMVSETLRVYEERPCASARS